MDRKKFKIEANGVLKEIAVNNYIKNGDIETLYLDIISMVNDLSRYINNKKIHLSSNYETKNLTVTVLKPLLKTYLLYNNTNNGLKRRMYFKSTIKEIKKFFNNNPTFGRRRVIPNRMLFSNTIMSPTNSLSTNSLSTNSLSTTNSDGEYTEDHSGSGDSEIDDIDSSDNNSEELNLEQSEEIDAEEIDNDSIS